MDYHKEIIDALTDVCERAKKNGQDEGYRVGEKVAQEAEYNKGLNDAWECAKKIYKMSAEEVITIFGGCSKWIDYSISEAITKIKEYEEKQFKKSCYNCAFEGCQVRDVGPEHPCGGWKPKQTIYEIKVGDEVVIDGRKGIIIRPVYYIGEDREPFVQVWYGTHMSSNSLNNVTITGRHFPQIVEVLEQIKEREK